MINATKSRGVMVGGTTLMTPGVTRVGPLAFKFNDLIKMMFRNNEQGIFLDPNDLTAEKINWRRNLLTYTQDASNTAWSKTQLTITTNATAAPDGTLTANKIVENSTISPHSVAAPNFNPVAGTTYVCSIYAKKGERSLIGLGNTSFADFANRWLVATFDLNTGTVVADVGGLSPTITAVGDGWYRLSILLTPTSVNVSGIFRVWLSSGNTGVTPSYQGDGVSGVYIWGAQIEVGTTASPYQAFIDFNTEFLSVYPKHALYQDAAGSIPVTAAWQPVGLILDKSKGLTLGSTIITNGNFESDTAWNKGAGWSISNGKARFDGTGSYSNLGGVVSTSINGKFFKVEIELSDVGTSVSQVRILMSGALAATIPVTGAGKYSAIVVGNSVNSVGIQTQAATGANYAFSLDNVSLKDLAGNHAYQTVSASRPILQQTPILGNELVVNGDFSNGTTGWTSNNATLNVVGGELEVTSTGGTGTSAAACQTITLSIGKKYRVTFKLRRGSVTGANQLRIGTNLGAEDVFIGQLSADTYREVEFTANTSGATISAGYGEASAGQTSYWDNISVKEVIGYRTGQNYLAFDGIDDFLQTNSIDFTATDKVSLFVGLRLLSDSTSILLETSTNTGTLANTGSFNLITGLNVSVTGYTSGSRGSGSLTSSSIAKSYTFVSPDNAVITSTHDILASLSTIRRNGIAGQNGTTSKGTGNFGNYPLFIGRRAGASLPFNGHIYSLIGIGRLTTDSETAALEKAIAKNTGVTL